MKQEYVIKTAYYKGKIDALEEVIRNVNALVLGSDDSETTVEMYREAISNLRCRIFREISEIKLV